TLQPALQGLLTLGSGNVNVLGSSGANGGTYLLVFTGALANANVPQVTVTSSLTGPAPQGATVIAATSGIGVGNEVQSLTLGGTSGGTFTPSFAGTAATAALTFTTGATPTAAQLQ